MAINKSERVSMCLFIMAIIPLLVTSSCQVSYSFLRDETFQNLRFSTGKIRTHGDVESQAECATKCNRHPNCISYFFNKDSSSCQTNSVIALNTAGSVVDKGTIYFRKKIDCPAPPSVANAQAQFIANTDPKVSGTFLEFVCDAGYTQHGNVTCQIDGTWTQMSCLKDCPSPPLIENSVQQFNAATVSTAQGTSLQYTCNSGFEAVDGITTITCQPGATWTSIVCKLPDCPSPPVIQNSVQQFSTSTVSRSQGTSLQYTCDSGFVPEDGIFSITCQPDATWSSIVCKRISTCSDVRVCNSQYGDGEYWMYPIPFGSTRAKIYCHTMSSSPSEFISLMVLNIGYSPALSNIECGGETENTCTNGGGRTEFSKIRVNTLTMEVNRSDSTFSTTSFGNFRRYGEAEDCYTIHYGGTKRTCGPKGTFKIDTTGTGLIVSKSLEFPVFGWNPWGEAVRNADGSKIDLLCGGWEGGCQPNGPMQLELNLLDEPSSVDVTTPECVYST